MKRYGWRFCGWLLAALPIGAKAQALVGDGLKADYYAGHNFERPVLTRHDATIDFNWHQSSPAEDVPAEDFSVHWTGFIMPPATGHYVLHLTVDDGMRLWLNGRQLLNEWRGQSISSYTVEVDLQAGVPCPLRIDYCQYAYDSRALLTWERPDKPAPLLGATSGEPSLAPHLWKLYRRATYSAATQPRPWWRGLRRPRRCQLPSQRRLLPKNPNLPNRVASRFHRQLLSLGQRNFLLLYRPALRPPTRGERGR